MNHYKTGLVVGKFAPLHLGHETLIRYAQQHCDRLLLLSWSHPEIEGYEAEQRERWLHRRFPEIETLVMTPEWVANWKSKGYEIPLLPENHQPDRDHHDFIAQLCLNYFDCVVDAVFTAEDYGDGFALSLQEIFSEKRGAHVPVIHERLDRFQDSPPISGTLIRSDIHTYRHLISSDIYADFVTRICLLGGESSGKSALTAALAKHYSTQYVAEYGRELWELQGGNLTYDDLLLIGKEQVKREENACSSATRYLFCDTSPLTTYLYSHWMFNQADPELLELSTRPYGLILLCAPDFPFDQDGTRIGEHFRQQQHLAYQQILQQRKIPYSLLTGTVEQRIKQVDALLSTLVNSPKEALGELKRK